MFCIIGCVYVCATNGGSGLGSLPYLPYLPAPPTCVYVPLIGGGEPNTLTHPNERGGGVNTEDYVHIVVTILLTTILFKKPLWVCLPTKMLSFSILSDKFETIKHEQGLEMSMHLFQILLLCMCYLIKLTFINSVTFSSNNTYTKQI